MKFNLLYSSELYSESCYIVTIENNEDYEVLSSILMKGDRTEEIYIDHVEYNANERNGFKIYGYKIKSITYSYYINFDYDENDLKEYNIRGINEMKIYTDRGSSLVYQYYDYLYFKEMKKYISDPNIQDRGFEILKKYMTTKYYCCLVEYGKKAFDSLEKEQLNVLFITHDHFSHLDEKTRENMKSHKYKKANIIIYDEDSKYYKELDDYGGIIGVLNEK